MDKTFKNMTEIWKWLGDSKKVLFTYENGETETRWLSFDGFMWGDKSLEAPPFPIPTTLHQWSKATEKRKVKRWIIIYKTGNRFHAIHTTFDSKEEAERAAKDHLTVCPVEFEEEVL
jgi:hypothetical protein